MRFQRNFMKLQSDRDTIPRQAFQVMAMAEELFRNQLRGIYLYGSSVLGGLHPNSDVDILIFIDGALPMDLREEFTKRLLPLSGKVGCIQKRPLEVTVINHQDLVPWQFPPKCEYMYGEWLREEITAGNIPQASYDPDITILLWQARTHSVPLKGKPAAVFIPPVSDSEIRKAIQHSLPGLIAGVKWDTRNVLLTLARMWFTLETGEICPKHLAAEWVLPKLPAPLAPLMEMAGKAYLGECADTWTHLEKEAALLADFMQHRLCQ